MFLGNTDRDELSIKPLDLPVNQILLGDAIEHLRLLPSDSIDACITSPPYFMMMDYETEGQYGLEPSIDAYLDRMAITFAEVYRVLKNGACCWIVLGDTSNNYSPVRSKGQRRKKGEYLTRRPMQEGYREKEVLGVPFKLIDRLRSVGYIHRNTLIWDKGSCGTLANSDTAACSHEYLIQLGKWNKSGRPYLKCKPIKSSVLKFSPTSDPVHPCPFPVELAEFLVERSTDPGDVILDPFSGVGSSAQASASIGRRYLGIELNPEFHQRSLLRLQQRCSPISKALASS